MAIFLLLIFFGLIGVALGAGLWFDGESSTWTPVLFFGGLLSMAVGSISIAVFF